MARENDVEKLLDATSRLTEALIHSVYGEAGVATKDIDEILHGAKIKRMNEGLNMIPSENVISPKARLGALNAMLAGLDGRYAEGNVGNRYYPGTEASDKLEAIAISEAKALFGVKYVDIRPISGNNANTAAFMSLVEGGDIVMSHSIYNGGHISHAKVGSLGNRIKTKGADLEGLIVRVPVTSDHYHTDPQATIEKINQYKPKLLVLGKSAFLFPEPVKEISETAKKVGTKIYYDGAHVLGLIAGKQFQDPLQDGAYILAGSTHKTFPGPQRGIILSNSELKEVDKGVMPGTHSNHHLQTIVPLIITIREMAQFGEEYAKQTISNAQALGYSLHKYGLTPEGKEFGFTKSHQVLLNVKKITGEYAKKVEGWLESNGIYANSNALPYDKSVVNTSGIRMGTPELTRRGMKEEHMDQIAWLFHKIIKERKDESLYVANFARCFKPVFFS